MSDFYQNWNWYLNEYATEAARSDTNSVRTILMEEGVKYIEEENKLFTTIWKWIIKKIPVIQNQKTVQKFKK
jgi:hypothetical protein